MNYKWLFKVVVAVVVSGSAAIIVGVTLPWTIATSSNPWRPQVRQC